MSNEPKTAKYLLLDCETTGLHACQNGLIQFAALILDQGLEILDQICVDICPPNQIVVDPVSLTIHNISQERIEKGLEYDQFCTLFLTKIYQYFDLKKNKPIVIGQFYPFDYSFLDQVFVTCGYEQSICREILGNDFIDTKSLVNTLNLQAEMKGQVKPFAITSLSKRGGLKDSLKIDKFQAHDALGDCLATREVLLKLLQNYF